MNYPNPHGPSCPWYDVTESIGAPNLKWCEETLCQWISEPANTWSNLGYLIAGIYTLYLAIKNKESFELKQFGPIIFFMGAMSFFYHLSNFYISQILDFVGMYLFTGWAIGMNLIRLGKLERRNLILFNLTVAFVFTIVLHLMYINGLKYQSIILIDGLVIIGTEYFLRKKTDVNYKNFYVAIFFLIIAFSFSIMDGQRIWCNPQEHGWFSQGHAVWHWSAAVAMFFIYFHYSQPALRLKKD